jgi:hypothetical protein
LPRYFRNYVCMVHYTDIIKDECTWYDVTVIYD